MKFLQHKKFHIEKGQFSGFDRFGKIRIATNLDTIALNRYKLIPRHPHTQNSVKV